MRWVSSIWVGLGGLLLAPPAVSQTRLIAHITRPDGGFTTHIIVENPTATALPFSLQPFDASGSPGTPVSGEIGPERVISYEVGELFESLPSHFEISDAAIPRFYVTYQAASGVSSPAHLAESAMRSQVWRLFPGDWSTVFDGIAVVNRGGEPAEVWIVQLDFEGQLLHAEKAFSALAPNGKGLWVIGGPAGSPFSPRQDALFEIWSSQAIAVTALRGTPPDAAIGVLWANTAVTLSAEHAQAEMVRLEMRRFVMDIAAAAHAVDPQFIIVPQNGLELLTRSEAADGALYEPYLSSLDGVAQEHVYYGQDAYDTPTPSEETAYLEGFLDRAVASGLTALVAEYCDTPESVDRVFDRANAKGYIAFAADRGYDLDSIPTYPDPIVRQNSDDVSTLSEARNFLYLINPEAFSTKEAFLDAVAASHYDLIIIDALFDDWLSRQDVARLQTKPQGARRLVLAYMNIGAAETWRPYWQASWRLGDPVWLVGNYQGYPDEFWVTFWHPEWRRIIIDGPDAYLGHLLDAGFDGVYLDNILCYEFFEASPQRDDGARPLAVNASGSLQNPAFSPDGNQLVLTRFRNGYNQGPADLLVFDRHTQTIRTLVEDGSDNVNLPGSSWNGMQNQIVFSSSREPHDEIFVIASNGQPGDEFPVTSRADRMAYEPSFSPDGTRIAFESHRLDQEGFGVITTFDLEDSQGYTELTPSQDDCRQPNWSPTGELIAYQKQEQGQWDIYVMNPDGTGKRRVTQGSGDKTDASFSPDGQWLVYSGELENGSANLFVVPVSGGEPIRITHFSGYDGAPSWSASGIEIAFESAASDPDGSAGTSLWVMTTDLLER